MRDIVAGILLLLAGGFFGGYLVFRPLIAIGDIPNEIEKLRESIDKLTKILQNR